MHFFCLFSCPAPHCGARAPGPRLDPVRTPSRDPILPKKLGEIGHPSDGNRRPQPHSVRELAVLAPDLPVANDEFGQVARGDLLCAPR